MKNKNLILLIFFVIISFDCFSQKGSFKIKGTITNDYEGYIYLSYGEKTDSTIVKDKKFTFEGVVDFPTESRLHIKNGYSAGDLYLENSVMEVNVSLTYGSTIMINSITGNKTAKLSSDLTKYFQEIKSDPEFALKLYKKLDSIFIKDPQNQFYGVLLSDIIMEPILSIEQLSSLYSKLDKSTMSKETVTSISLSFEKLSKFKIGAKFNSFELPDTKGNIVNTSNYKNKILLIEIWASWCGPCRQSNPALKQIYDHFKKDGFEIFGVSIDSDKKAWLKAIKEDNLTWINTIAEKGWHNKVVRSLGIQLVPSNFLIDKNGVILAFNIDPLTLKKKLDEILVK